jgi:RNA 3'-terminal phosphate cyclase-like protein
MAHSGSLIHFSGHQYLRNRLVLSILSGKPVRVDKIRSEDKNPGLRGELLNRCTPEILTILERF